MPEIPALWSLAVIVLTLFLTMVASLTSKPASQRSPERLRIARFQMVWDLEPSEPSSRNGRFRGDPENSLKKLLFSEASVATVTDELMGVSGMDTFDVAEGAVRRFRAGRVGCDRWRWAGGKLPAKR